MSGASTGAGDYTGGSSGAAKSGGFGAVTIGGFNAVKQRDKNIPYYIGAAVILGAIYLMKKKK